MPYYPAPATLVTEIHRMKIDETGQPIQPPGVALKEWVMGRFNAAEKANLDIILAMQDANSAARFVEVGNAVTMTLIP